MLGVSRAAKLTGTLMEYDESPDLPFPHSV